MAATIARPSHNAKRIGYDPRCGGAVFGYEGRPLARCDGCGFYASRQWWMGLVGIGGGMISREARLIRERAHAAPVSERVKPNAPWDKSRPGPKQRARERSLISGPPSTGGQHE